MATYNVMRVKNHMNKTLQNGINRVRFSELLKLFKEVKSASAGRLFQVRIVLVKTVKTYVRPTWWQVQFVSMPSSGIIKLRHKKSDIDAFSTKIACFFHPTHVLRPYRNNTL